MCHIVVIGEFFLYLLEIIEIILEAAIKPLKEKTKK
jgi:hypothetical protein